MKQFFTLFLLLVIALTAVPGCKKDNKSTYKLHMAITAAFIDDQLKIQVDAITVFDKKITSRPFPAFAEEITLQKKAGVHTIRITLNNDVVKTFSYTLRKDSDIAIWYSREAKKIGYGFNTNPFEY